MQGNSKQTLPENCDKMKLSSNYKIKITAVKTIKTIITLVRSKWMQEWKNSLQTFWESRPGHHSLLKWEHIDPLRFIAHNSNHSLLFPTAIKESSFYFFQLGNLWVILGRQMQPLIWKEDDYDWWWERNGLCACSSIMLYSRDYGVSGLAAQFCVWHSVRVHVAIEQIRVHTNIMTGD